MLFSDSNSNSKKRKENSGFGYDATAVSEGQGDYGSLDLDLDSPVGEWAASKARTQAKLEGLAATGGDSQRFTKSAISHMLPKDTPERRRMVYATSPQALDDVVGDFYNSEVKSRFEANKNESQQKAREEYMKYASVPGADPVNAYHQAMRADNPLGVIDKTMEEIDQSRLMKEVAPLAAYGGFDADDYVAKVVNPSLHDRMVGEYVEESKPKSSGEYILRSALGNSVVGKAAMLANNAMIGNDTHSLLESEGRALYDANRTENFLAGVGSLLIDTPVFGGFGSLSGATVGKATSLAANRLATRFIARNAGRNISREYATRVATRAIKESLSGKIVQSAMGQGLTLGNYDLANSVVEDLLYNNGVDLGKAAGSFAKGFATGGAVGTVGTPLKLASQGLTGGKKLFASAGVLSAESAVFTLGSEAQKIMQGVDIEPIDLIYDFGESAATLLTMRLAHWRPKGAELKLDANGRLKEGLRFTRAEREELRQNNVDADGFMAAIEQELGMPSFGGRNAEMVKESYSQLMTSGNLSASLRSKLLVLIENKITSTPPLAFDYTVKRGRDGSVDVTMLDANGGIVARQNFSDVENAKSFVASERGNIRRNRISYYEHELTSGVNTQNFLRQGGRYVKEKGINADVLAEAMLKKASNAELTAAEQKIIDEVIARSSYDNAGIITYLYDQRRAIESRYGFDEGTLLYLVDKPARKCTPAENRALDDYEKIVRDEVSRLRGGVDEARYKEIFDHGMARDFMGEDNDAVKRQEMVSYGFRKLFDKNGKNTLGNFMKSMPGERPVYIPEMKNPDAVWSGRGLEKTREEVENYRKHAEKLASKLNMDIKLITDEREIELANRHDSNRVEEYNRRVGSLGWVNDGKVYLNLPNMESVAELEKTAVHEAVTHAGLRKIFGNHLNDFLEEIYKKADRGVLEGIREVKRRNYTADSYEVMEEYLAELVERGYRTPQENRVLSRFKEFIKNMLVRKNIYTGKNRMISEQELEELMQKHCRHILANGNLDAAYRRRMFGGFETANYDDARYTDRSVYEDYMRDTYANESAVEGTPRFMRNTKLLHNYRYLPENIKARMREKLGMDDAEIESMVQRDRYRFIGKKGAENLALYKSRDSGFNEAERLEQEGADPATIKYMTGWERGVDKKWRKEVSDRKLKVKDYVGSVLLEGDHDLFTEYYNLTSKPQYYWNENDLLKWDIIISESKELFRGMKLKDVISDPTFFASYPDLKELPVSVVANAPQPVRYDSKNKQLVVDRNLFFNENKEREMAGALQNVVQDYEGFSKAMSMHLIALETDIAKEYEKAAGGIALARELIKEFPELDMGELSGNYIMKKYGMSPEEFMRRFPSLDDFMIYKLSDFNVYFSGDVEMKNVKNRYGMSNLERRMTLAEDTEGYPREDQVPVMSIEKLQKVFSGPLDIVNSKLKLLHSDTPLDTYMKYKIPPRIVFDLREIKDLSELFDENLYGRAADDYGLWKYKSQRDQRKSDWFLKKRKRRDDDEDEDAMLVLN